MCSDVLFEGSRGVTLSEPSLGTSPGEVLGRASPLTPLRDFRSFPGRHFTIQPRCRYKCCEGYFFRCFEGLGRFGVRGEFLRFPPYSI